MRIEQPVGLSEAKVYKQEQPRTQNTNKSCLNENAGIMRPLKNIAKRGKGQRKKKKKIKKDQTRDVWDSGLKF